MRLCLRLLCFGVRSAAPIRRSDWQECEGHAQGNRATPLPSWCYVSCSVGSIRSSDRLSARRGGSQQACASNLASSKLGNNCARLRVMIVYFCSFSSFKLPKFISWVSVGWRSLSFMIALVSRRGQLLAQLRNLSTISCILV